MNPFSTVVSLFDTLFFIPIINIMALLINGFSFLSAPSSLGFSIIALTAIIRLLIWPLMTAQLRSSHKMSTLKPHIDKLKQKHKGDQQAFAKAQMDLFRQHGINPLAGCLPALIQIPIFFALYQVIFAFFDEKGGLNKINDLIYPFFPNLSKMPDPNFLGLNLASKPSEFSQYGWYLLLVPAVTALLTFIQSKMMAPKPVKPYPSDSTAEKKEKENVSDAMASMQSQMTFLLPIMVGFFSWQFPIGLALYWNTFTIFGIIQQYKIMGLGGLQQWIKKK